MNMGKIVRCLGCVTLIGLIALSTSAAHAVNVTMTGSDGFGTSSFNAAGNWDNLAAPSAGNDYFTGNFILRTPADPNSYTFAGDSLTINNTTPYPDGLFYKGTGTTGVITINNLILDGGLISHGNGPGDLFQLDGNITVNSDSEIYAKQGSIDILAPISGNATITVPTADGPGRTLTFLSSASTFTGNIVNDGEFTLADNAVLNFDIGATGVNNSVSGVGTAVFGGDFNFDLTGAGTTSGDSWTIANVTNQSFDPNTFNVVGFTQSGSVWTSGIYTFNPGTGILAVAAPPVEWANDIDGAFNNAANWTGGSVPSVDGDASFGPVITANRTVTVDSNLQLNSITFSNAGDGDYFLSDDPNSPGNVVTLTGEAKIDLQAGRHWVRTEIAGTAGLNLTGPGELVLDSSNSFSGGLVVDDTNLAITNNNAIPAGNAITAQNGAAVRFVGADNAFFSGFGSGIDPNSQVNVGSAVSIDATSQLQVTDGADVAITGVISGDGAVQSLGGELTLSAANTHAGVTSVGTGGTGGTLTVTNSSALGVSDGTAASQTAIDGGASTGKLVLSGGVAVGNELIEFGARQGDAIDAVGLSSENGNNSLAGNISGVTGGTQYNIESADSGSTLTLSGTISAPDTFTRTFVFSGAGDTNITGRITDLDTDATGEPDPNNPLNNLDNVNVVKRGTGTLTISTASSQQNDYWQASTTIEEGTLEVKSNGAGSGELFSQTVTVQANGTLDVSDWAGDVGTPDYNLQAGQTLGGAGTVDTGSIALGVFDDNSLTPGDSVGTLNVTGNVTIKNGGGGGFLNYELGDDKDVVGGAENDLIQIGGALTTAVNANFTVNVQPVDFALETGNYRLINHGGGATTFGATSAQVLNPTNPDPNNPLNTRHTFSVSGATSGQVNLTVGNAAANQTWTGSTDGDWDVQGKANWTGTDNQFRDLDNVTFSGTGANQAINVTQDVVPASVTITGSGSDYTFSGSSITTSSVTVSSNAVATFDNTVGGDVSVQSTATVGGTGTLQNNVSVASGGTLRIGDNGLNSVSSGSVSLFEDFESYTVGTYNGGSTAFVANGGPWQSNTGGGTGLVSIEELDPNTPSANKYAAFGWNAGVRGVNATIPTIAEGNTGTVYFQVRSEDATPDASYGVTDDATGALGAFGNFEAQVALVEDGDAGNGQFNLIARDGGGFTAPLQTGLTPNTFYDVWLVLDNASDTYDVFFGTSGNPNGIASAVKVAEGLGFRNGAAANDLITFMTLANGHEDNNANLDNIYTGNLTATGGPATMNVQGDLSLAAGSIFSFDIGDSGLNDSIDIDGSLTVADGVVLEVVLDGAVSAASLEAGDSWDLLDFDPNSVIGSWDPNDFTLPGGLASGLDWDTSNLLTTGVLSIVSLENADFDGNDIVNGLDFLIWQQNAGGAGTAATGDANSDGQVNSADLAIWESQYGTAPLNAAVTAVPEPSSLVLLLAGLCGLARRHRS